MATSEEIYAKALSSEEEKTAFAQAFATVEGAKEYLAQRGCDATPEEFIAFLREQHPKFGELSDEELGDAAGGKWGWWIDLVCTVGTFGILCVVNGVVSLISDTTEGYDLDREGWTSALCTHPSREGSSSHNGPLV